MLRRDGSRYLTRLAGPPIALPTADLAGYTPAQIGFAARAWAMKAEEEHRSAAVVTEIVAGLLATAAPVDALQRAPARSFAAYAHAVALPALRRLEAGEDIDPRLVELGVIPPAVRVETFYRAIERVALPRLTRLGFDGRRAWDDRYRVTA